MHPAAKRVIDNLSARLDLNGDEKLDAADLRAAADRARSEANEFVAEKTPLTALGITAAVGAVVGVILTKLFFC